MDIVLQNRVKSIYKKTDVKSNDDSDFIINVEWDSKLQCSFYVQKYILERLSKYFSSLFSSDVNMKECRDGSITSNVNNVQNLTVTAKEFIPQAVHMVILAMYKKLSNEDLDTDCFGNTHLFDMESEYTLKLQMSYNINIVQYAIKLCDIWQMDPIILERLYDLYQENFILPEHLDWTSDYSTLQTRVFKKLGTLLLEKSDSVQLISAFCNKDEAIVALVSPFISPARKVNFEHLVQSDGRSLKRKLDDVVKKDKHPKKPHFNLEVERMIPIFDFAGKTLLCKVPVSDSWDDFLEKVGVNVDEIYENCISALRFQVFTNKNDVVSVFCDRISFPSLVYLEKYETLEINHCVITCIDTM